MESETFSFNFCLCAKGLFSVQSVYAYLINSNFHFHRKQIWKFKLPLKVKIFLWYLSRVVIITNGNLDKNNWIGSNYFYQEEDYIQHLFFVMITLSLFCMAFNIASTGTVVHIFEDWLRGQSGVLNSPILLIIWLKEII